MSDISGGAVSLDVGLIVSTTASVAVSRGLP